MLLEDKTRRKIPYPAKMCTYPLLEAQGRNSRPLLASLLNPPLLLESLLHPHLPPPPPGHNSFLGSGPLACLHQPSSHSPASQFPAPASLLPGPPLKLEVMFLEQVSWMEKRALSARAKSRQNPTHQLTPHGWRGQRGGSSEVGQIPVLLLTSCHLE